MSAEQDLSIEVIIYSDGACRGNPGIGGWGAILRGQGRYQGRVKKVYGGEYETTNNRMELLAAIKALKALKRATRVALYTDSRYVQQGITEWIDNWRKRGWKTANKKPIKNQDLWQELDGLNSKHAISWNWVKGHAGVEDNEIADQLANQGIDELLDNKIDSEEE